MVDCAHTAAALERKLSSVTCRSIFMMYWSDHLDEMILSCTRIACGLGNVLVAECPSSMSG